VKSCSMSCQSLHLVRVRASQVGLLAYLGLPEALSEGRVHSVFRHAVNICQATGDGVGDGDGRGNAQVIRHGLGRVNGDGRDNPGWLCLHDEDTALHPYSVRAEGDSSCGNVSPSIQPGDCVLVSRAALEFPDAGIDVAIGTANVWDSYLRPFGELPGAGCVGPNSAAAVLMRIVTAGDISSSFLSAVVGSAIPAHSSVASRATRDLAREKIFRLVGEIRDGWIAGQEEAVSRLAGQLVGLGPGLTPSGDDFLLGLLAADHFFSRAGMDAPRAVFDRLPPLLESTTTVSRLMLEAALAGHFAAPVSDLLASIVEEGEEEIRSRKIRESVARLRKVGATSGEDVLAGIILWLDTGTWWERS